MPYITNEEKQVLDPALNVIEIETLGELNYAVTKLCLNYLAKLPHNYSNMQNILGTLASAQQEFYRRMMSPYEDIKKGQNGDVYPYYL